MVKGEWNKRSSGECSGVPLRSEVEKQYLRLSSGNKVQSLFELGVARWSSLRSELYYT